MIWANVDTASDSNELRAPTSNAPIFRMRGGRNVGRSLANAAVEWLRKDAGFASKTPTMEGRRMGVVIEVGTDRWAVRGE